MPQISINNFHKGQSTTQYVANGAFSKSQNLDVFSQPGIARINYLPVDLDATAGEIADIPVSIDRQDDNDNIFYIGSQDDIVQQYAISTSTMTNKGSGGKFTIYWKGYLLGAGTGVGNIKYNSSGTTWANLADNSGTVGSGEHFMFKSSFDDKVYVCNGQNVGTITEDTNFDPSNAATHTWNSTAFALPEGYLSYSIADLNSKLVVAAVRSKSSSNPETIAETALFIWDLSTDLTNPVNIIRIPEADMTTMVNVGNDIYLSGGENGRIFKLINSLSEFAQIPFDLDDNKKIKVGRFGHQSLAWWNNRLMVGVSSDDGLSPAGIYGVTPDGRIVHEYLTSEGFDGSTKDIRIGAMYTLDENNFLFGWENNTDGTHGLDRVQTSGNRVTSYTAYLETDMRRVGTQEHQAQFSDIDIQLARDLQTGEGVRLKYRTNTEARGTHSGSSGASVLTDSTASFTNMNLVGTTVRNITDNSSGTITAVTKTTITATLSGGTDNDWDTDDEYLLDGYITIKTRDDREFTFAQYGAINSFSMPFGLKDAQNVQFRVDLTTGSSSKNTPYLLDITIPYANS